MRRSIAFTLLFVGTLLANSCATTRGTIHTGAEVSIGTVSGLVFGGNLIRRTADEISRSQGPLLYWQNRHGGWELITYDGYTIPLTSDRGHVTLQLVCNCNPRSAVLLRNGIQERTIHEGSWQVHVRNRHTNARQAFTARIGCEEDPTTAVWERHFYVLASGPRMDGGRRW